MPWARGIVLIVYYSSRFLDGEVEAQMLQVSQKMRGRGGQSGFRVLDNLPLKKEPWCPFYSQPTLLCTYCVPAVVGHRQWWQQPGVSGQPGQLSTLSPIQTLLQDFKLPSLAQMNRVPLPLVLVWFI